MISLLREHKLNPRTKFEQEIIMGIFIQATENYIHMHAKFEYLNVHMLL
jgi:hypothetical protein